MAEVDWDRCVGAAEDVRRVFDAIPAMVFAFDGPQHRFLAANAAYRTLFPKVCGNFGLPVRDLFPELEQQLGMDHVNRAYRTGETQYGSEWRLQIDVDDSGTLQERFYDFVTAPYRRADGSVAGVLVMAFDVTARVRDRMAAEARAEELSERYAQTHESATMMQRALLASSVPVLPGVDIAAEYVVAAGDTAAGGDWFEAITLPGERVALVVGDVVGHGVEAAAVMAQLRTALRIELHDGRAIADALAVVDRFSALVPGARSATICVGVLDTQTGELRYCTAGHPPPLLIPGDAMPRYLELSGAGPLGSGTGFAVRTETLNVGDTLLLYTDGIIERPGRPVAASTAEFAMVAADILGGKGFPAAEATCAVDRLCSQALELLLRTTGYSDDVTLLAAQRTKPPPPLHVVVDADARAAAAVRADLREWLRLIGASAVDAMVIEHAAGEYVQNAADHAYRGQQAADITVDAELRPDGTVHGVVVDRGSWRDPVGSSATAGRGRGLTMAGFFVTQSTVVGDAEGTRAEFSHRLAREARIVTGPHLAQPPWQAAAPSDAFTISGDGDRRIAVTGDVDSTTAPTLAAQINVDSHSGTVGLTIDLTGVTHLGSAGISALVDARERARRQGTRLTLIAPPGTTAHHVLSLVALPILQSSDADLFTDDTPS